MFNDKSKLAEILLGALFVQVLCGGALTYYFNNKISAIQNEMLKSISEKQRMEQLAIQINDLTFGRLYRMNRMLDYYRSPDQGDDYNKLRSQYSDILDRWNMSLGNNERDLEIYFGAENAEFFKGSVRNKFLEIHKRLTEALEKYNKHQIPRDQLDKELINLGVSIKALTDSIYVLNDRIRKKLETKIKEEPRN